MTLLEMKKGKTAEDVIQQALDDAPNMESVIILCEYKKGMSKTSSGSYDNDLTIAKCLWLLETFKHWLLSKCVS